MLGLSGYIEYKHRPAKILLKNYMFLHVISRFKNETNPGGRFLEVHEEETKSPVFKATDRER